MATPRNPNALATQFNAGGLRRRDAERGMARMQRENASRIPCPHCSLMILPGAMHVHIEIAHGDDE